MDKVNSLRDAERIPKLSPFLGGASQKCALRREPADLSLVWLSEVKRLY